MCLLRPACDREAVGFSPRRTPVNEYRSIKLPHGLGPFPVLISNSRRRPADPVSLMETYLFSLLPTLLSISLLHVRSQWRFPSPCPILVVPSCCISWSIDVFSRRVLRTHACTRVCIQCTQRWLIDRESTLFYWSPHTSRSPLFTSVYCSVCARYNRRSCAEFDVTTSRVTTDSGKGMGGEGGLVRLDLE